MTLAFRSFTLEKGETCTHFLMIFKKFCACLSFSRKKKHNCVSNCKEFKKNINSGQFTNTFQKGIRLSNIFRKHITKSIFYTKWDENKKKMFISFYFLIMYNVHVYILMLYKYTYPPKHKGLYTKITQNAHFIWISNIISKFMQKITK